MKKRKIGSFLLALMMIVVALSNLSPVHATSHRVVVGDTWWNLSRKFGVNMHELARVNNKTTSDMILVGQILQIPKIPSPEPSTPNPRPYATHRVVRGESW